MMQIPILNRLMPAFHEVSCQRMMYPFIRLLYVFRVTGVLSATCHYEIKQFTSPGRTFPARQCQHKGKTVVLLCLLRVLECTVLFGRITINNIRCRLLLRVYRGLFICLCVFLCIGGSRI